MTRTADVKRLFASVREIGDAKQFQEQIAKEPAPFVLADLREKFWDGKGKKPCQVIELNRRIIQMREHGSREFMSKRLQQLLAFLFGIIFVIALLALALFVPDPTPFQYIVFRVVLALAAAGVAAMIPGFLQVEIGAWLRAGGALAVFVVVYFYNPAALVTAETKPDPTAFFPIVLACSTSGQVTIDTYSFPYADIESKATAQAFRSLVAQLPNRKCDQTASAIFRMKDEILLQADGKTTATSGGNLGVIVIPAPVVAALGGNHLAFTKLHSQEADPPGQ